MRVLEDFLQLSTKLRDRLRRLRGILILVLCKKSGSRHTDHEPDEDGFHALTQYRLSDSRYPSLFAAFPAQLGGDPHASKNGCDEALNSRNNLFRTPLILDLFICGTSSPGRQPKQTLPTTGNIWRMWASKSRAGDAPMGRQKGTAQAFILMTWVSSRDIPSVDSATKMSSTGAVESPLIRSAFARRPLRRIARREVSFRWASG